MFKSITICAISAFALMSGTALASTVFSDSTFNLANYSTAFAYTSNAGSSATFSQCATCGDPGSALRVTIIEDGSEPYTTTDVLTGIINNTFTYDPSAQGTISSIGASVDKNFTVSANVAYNNRFRPIIEQDGNFYSAAISGPVLNGPGSTGYTTISNGDLLASDFSIVDVATGTFGTAHPNFSGDTITFGIAQLLASAGYPSATFADYDNLSISVNSVSAVPLPAALPLLGTSLLGLSMIARRRRR